MSKSCCMSHTNWCQSQGCRRVCLNCDVLWQVLCFVCLSMWDCVTDSSQLHGNSPLHTFADEFPLFIGIVVLCASAIQCCCL
jgi:hypothetical protein